MSVSPRVPDSGSAATFAAAMGSADRLKKMPQAQQVKAVAGQFEAIMLRQLLEDSVSKVMGGDKGGPTGNVYGYMMTDVLANKLSEAGGMGLSKLLEQQLSPTPRATSHPSNPVPNP